MKKIIAFIIASSPLLALAQAPLQNIDDVAGKATNIGNLVIALAISLAVVWIIINVVIYLVAGGDVEKRKEGGMRILFGVIGLFVILSIWGLVAILRSSFRTQDQAPSTREINAKVGLPIPDRVQ
ncbi:MAG TPA: hypothetical protein VJJ28_00745 [Candidatus Paceibacterota bacterium]